MFSFLMHLVPKNDQKVWKFTNAKFEWLRCPQQENTSEVLGWKKVFKSSELKNELYIVLIEEEDTRENFGSLVLLSNNIETVWCNFQFMKLLKLIKNPQSSYYECSNLYFSNVLNGYYSTILSDFWKFDGI